MSWPRTAARVEHLQRTRPRVTARAPALGPMPEPGPRAPFPRGVVVPVALPAARRDKVCDDADMDPAQLKDELGLTDSLEEIVDWARQRTAEVIATGVDEELAGLLGAPVTVTTVKAPAPLPPGSATMAMPHNGGARHDAHEDEHGLAMPPSREVTMPRVPLPAVPLPPVPQRPDLAADAEEGTDVDELEMLDEGDLELMESDDDEDDDGSSPEQREPADGDDVAGDDGPERSAEWKRALADAQSE